MIRTIFREASTGVRIAEILLPAPLQRDDAVQLPNGFTYIVTSTSWAITAEVDPKGVSIPILNVRLR